MSILLAQKKTKLKRVFLFCVATLVRFFFTSLESSLCPGFRFGFQSCVKFGMDGMVGLVALSTSGAYRQDSAASSPY